jgi:hypothetical protein
MAEPRHVRGKGDSVRAVHSGSVPSACSGSYLTLPGFYVGAPGRAICRCTKRGCTNVLQPVSESVDVHTAAHHSLAVPGVLRMQRTSMSAARRDEATKAYAIVVLCALALLVAWVLVLPRVPAGWPRIAVNGAGYALSIVVISGGYDQLKRTLRPFRSFLIAAVTWALLFVLLREILLSLLSGL